MTVTKKFFHGPYMPYAFSVLAVLLLFPRYVYSDDGESLAAALSKIRIEVEALSHDVESKKDEVKNRLRAISAQKAELEMELVREEMRLKQLKLEKADRTARLADDKNRDGLLEPVVVRSVEVIKKVISKGLPFKKEERLEELDKILERRATGLISSADAAARLWDRVEDELRLSGEMGIYKQTVTVDGKEMLVDVARIGMIMLYYRTKDGSSGRAVYDSGEWKYESLTDPKNSKRIDMLFDSFRKQIRSGFFELPAALPPAWRNP